MNGARVADPTLEELRTIIRAEIEKVVHAPSEDEQDEAWLTSDLSDFPVDSYGSWPADLTLRRAEMYDDDGR
jgi:hypothetical protein